MNQTYTFIALDIARERAREAAAMRRADALFTAPAERRPPRPRRGPGARQSRLAGGRSPAR